jgi:hypothetical protein
MPSNSEASLSNSGDETIGRHGGSAAFCFPLFASPSRSVGLRVYVIEIDKLAFGPHARGSVRERHCQVDECRHFPPHGGCNGSELRFRSFSRRATGRTTLRRTGVVTYICRFHPGMNGRLDVAP